MTSTSFVLKTVFRDDTRRVQVDPVSGFSFAKLQELLRGQFKKKATNKNIFFVDDEGDKLTITSDAELREAFRVASEAGWKSLRLLVGSKAAKTARKGNEATVPAPESLPEQEKKNTPPAAAKAVHWGFQCDGSGVKPIRGARFHKQGENFDLCEEEFAKLSAEEQASFDKIEQPASWWNRFKGHGGWRKGWRKGARHHHGVRHHAWHHGHPQHGRVSFDTRQGPHHGGPRSFRAQCGNPPHGGPSPPAGFGCFSGFGAGGRGRGGWTRCFLGAKVKKLFWLLRNADLEPLLAILKEAGNAAGAACEPLQMLSAAIQDEGAVRTLKRMARSPAAQKLRAKAHEVHGRVSAGALSCLEAPRALLDSDEWAVAVAQLRDVLPRVASAVEKLGEVLPKLAGEVPLLLPKLMPVVMGLFMTASWKKKGGHKKSHKQQQEKRNATKSGQTEKNLRAKFVSDVSIPDGTVVAPGATFTKTWTVRNTGGRAWPNGTALLHVGGDMELRASAARISVGTVAPGGERPLSVELTAPAGDGRYWSYWRLVAGEGPAPQRFGPRLWADISVKTSEKEADAETPSAAEQLDALLHTPITEEEQEQEQEQRLDAVLRSSKMPSSDEAAPAMDPRAMLGTAATMLGTAATMLGTAAMPEGPLVQALRRDALLAMEPEMAKEESSSSSSSSSEEETERPKQEGGCWEEAAAMLTAMGYQASEFQARLVHHNGDVQAVLEELLG